MVTDDIFLAMTYNNEYCHVLVGTVFQLQGCVRVFLNREFPDR